MSSAVRGHREIRLGLKALAWIMSAIISWFGEVSWGVCVLGHESEQTWITFSTIKLIPPFV